METDTQKLFLEFEKRNGTRFSWNIWPANRALAQKCVIPVSCMYTPLHPLALDPRPYQAVQCSACAAFLNPFCTVDYTAKLWMCPFCLQRNHFPPMFESVTETNRPAELYPEYSTIEYALPPAKTTPPAFVFVVDSALDAPQFDAIKDSVLLAMSTLPEYALVGLIVFGTSVHMYELSFPHCPKMFSFRGNSPGVDPKILQGILSTNPMRFLSPLRDVEAVLENILSQLQREARALKNDRRALRATGTAVGLAVQTVAVAVHGAARILVFAGGPCTQGIGAIVTDDLREGERGWNDVVKGNAKHVPLAMTYYTQLAALAVEAGIVVDVFGCSLHDVGFFEMSPLIRATNGLIVTADKFFSDRFKTSFQKIFARDENGHLRMAFDGILSVKCSTELKILGAIGNCASLKHMTPDVSADRETIGMGDTNTWKFCALDTNTSLALYFDVATLPGSPAKPMGLIQIKTTYRQANGTPILRVTTICNTFVDVTQDKMALLYGFDQEAAVALIARWAVVRAEKAHAVEILRWLDRALIRLCSFFGDYRPNEPQSFQMHPNMALLPQFLFHLRRGYFLQVFNSSPDETTFFRLLLTRECVSNIVTMVQPVMLAYSFERGCEPVELSARSITPDRILLLDAFFTLVMLRGERVAQWIEAGYDKNPAYEAFQKLLAWPKTDADTTIAERFPTPRFVECDQNGSQARFLLAIVDPAVTHTTTIPGAPAGGEVIFSEDVCLGVFVEHLRRLAVAAQ